MQAERAIHDCALDVRRHDYDRYLCALFADASARKRLFVLYALNLELSRIPELVSEPALGDIRLQWWRDTVAGIYQGTPREHPVALALAGTDAAHILSRAALDRLIDARARDLDETPIPDRDALIDYVEGTSSTLLTLAFEALGITDADCRAVAVPLGRAWAMIGLLRATGYFARRGQCFLPANLMAEARVDRAAFLRGHFDAPAGRVIAEVADWAARDLADAGRMKTPRAALPVTLLAALTRAYLKRLERAAFNPFDARLTISPIARQMTLLVRAAVNRP